MSKQGASHAQIIENNLEDIMHESFMPYAEYVILERAIPRVEDGLKPVQRRILYSMYEQNILPDVKHKKCARIVGDTMGKYHPHGDTSIYDALARMAQDFSMRSMLVDGQGNFGSIDGDSPAAMRYTEARLAPIAMEMLRDIEKETVPFRFNFDDTLKEPDMLPARYPNLLVNGATGIAVGIATNIPPHNLGEVVDGTIFRMQHPDGSLAEMMQYIKGPDFPTGGVLLGMEGLKEAYRTGRGKITLRAKTHMEKGDNGKTRIVVTELPFEVKESAMLRKIQSLRETKKEMFSGIDNIRSETDRQGIRAVVEIKKGHDAGKILDCLLKYSDMQITYGINMMAIAQGQPRQMGLLELLDAYIAHQRGVVSRRVQFDLEQAQEREHKLAGLIIAVRNIDEVIRIIRTSKNTKEARQRLMKTFDLTGVQAQAILDMRLARLTSIEVETLEQQYAEVVALIKNLTEILGSREKLDGVIIQEMRDIKKKYADPRRTVIEEKSAEIKIDTEHFKVVEDCAVILTRAGNLKRLSKKALQKGMEGNEVEEKNKPRFLVEGQTESKIQIITNKGNLYTVKAEAIREAKYRDAGAPLNTMITGVEQGERIADLRIISDFGAGELLFVTKSGMVKRTETREFEVKKAKVVACGLKTGDEILLVEPYDPEAEILLITRAGMSIRFKGEEVSTMGKPAKGVGGMKLAYGDEILFAAQVKGDGLVVVITDTGYMKGTLLKEYETQGRNGKGLKTVNLMKNGENGTQLFGAYYLEKPCVFTAVLASGQVIDVNSAEIPQEARNAKGTQLIPALLGDTVEEVYQSAK